MPVFISEEILARTAEIVCYFLTALGGVISFLFMPRS